MLHQEPVLLDFAGLTADQKKLITNNYQSDRSEYLKERDAFHHMRVMIISEILAFLKDTLKESLMRAFPNYVNESDVVAVMQKLHEIYTTTHLHVRSTDFANQLSLVYAEFINGKFAVRSRST